MYLAIVGRIALGSSLGCIHTALDSLSDHRVVESGVIEFMATATVPIYDAFRTLFVHFGRAPLFPLLSVTFPLYTWLSPSWHASSRLVRNFMAQKVEERRREQDLRQPLELATDADCVLDMLLQQEKSQGKKALNENEMLDELLLLFLGGHDSTSAALFWLVKYMALDAEMQRRLHDEVCHVFSHDLEDTSSIVLSTLEDSEKLPILEAVVAETLRCAMISGAIGRYLTSDEVIMGRHVPKGTELVIPVSLMGMSEAAWGPDVKEWRPTRWLRADGSFNRNAGPGGNPFGLGHRACFGQRLGMMKLKIFAATLSRAFFFKPAPLKVSSPHAITMVTRQPKQCYVVLEEWDA
ncbi:hypothetical protein FRC12_012166 [Ceratobasidium sp. 428]|nr:hypothetical protein FRC12_012166 [Ceratobasidium sp. 428]